MWVAKLCLNKWGYTRVPSPAFRAHTPAANADEYCLLAGGSERDARTHPDRDRLPRLSSDRHDAGFPALAGDPDCSVAQIDVAHVEPDQLRKPKSGRIEELQHGPVTNTDRIITADFQESGHLVHVERARKAARRPRCRHADARVLFELSFMDQIFEKTARAGEPTLHAARIEPVAMAHGGKTPQLLRSQIAPPLYFFAVAELGEADKVPPVARDGVDRQTPYERNVAKKIFRRLPLDRYHEVRCRAARLTAA